MQTAKRCQVPVSQPRVKPLTPSSPSVSTYSTHSHQKRTTSKSLTSIFHSLFLLSFSTPPHYSCFLLPNMTLETHSLHCFTGFMILILRQIKDDPNTSKATLTWTVKRQIVQLIGTLNTLSSETPEFPPHRLSTVC